MVVRVRPRYDAVAMRRTACLLLLALGCPAPLTSTTGLGVDPDGVHLAGTESTGDPPADSTSTSTTGARESTGEPASTGGSASTSEPQPDFGPIAPAGCAGKIDFLFVIAGTEFVFEETKIQEAIPGFYNAIAGALPDFDTHMLVAKASGGTVWGTNDCSVCLEDCDPNGEPPLCGAELTACDATMGAGVTFPIGEGASNHRCDLAGGRRYVTREDPDPLAAFECVATIGEGGDGRAGEVMYEAIGPTLNGPGGCNEGFVRDDALLVVTIISGWDTVSNGHIYTWTNKLLAAKHGDPDAFLVLVISGDADIPDGVCSEEYLLPPNRLRTFAEYVPNGMFASICEKSYVPFFTEAVEKVVELCDSFIPQ